MHFLTDFGDEIILLPLAAAALLWLGVHAGRRAALLWAASVLLCAGCTALLKIYFDACAVPLRALSSPSGHTSMSTLVYGSLALIVGAETLAWQRFTAVALGTAMVFGIALSRIVVGVHTGVEVVIGLIIGGITLALFARTYLEARPVGAPIWSLMTAAAIILIVFHGHSLRLEPTWHAIAAYLHAAAGLCRA